jgi:hypothetical protein
LGKKGYFLKKFSTIYQQAAFLLLFRLFSVIYEVFFRLFRPLFPLSPNSFVLRFLGGGNGATPPPKTHPKTKAKKQQKQQAKPPPQTPQNNGKNTPQTAVAASRHRHPKTETANG